ncbi:thioredoxin family protein [Natronomonas salina]|uniref:thioredoxin family protein n=1 Tax=Natronomonas salina TaxID=1710540 RepID=UPI0015B4EF2A|nr:thioredoxin family protein [Natronomonas salina]QLD88237.1 thioredoxin family protein [Natronomonas salina]
MVALDAEPDALQRGDEAPDFELEGTDGETHSLDDFADREALLLVFTCNHCPYAQAKFDAMNAIAADYDEVAVVGVNPNDAEEYPEDSVEKMVEYVDRGEIDVDAYLRDESQAVAEAYGAVCTPDPFLFENAGGSFQLAYHGRLDDAQDPDSEPSGEPGFEMREAIDAVLAGEEPTDEFRPSRGCSIKWRE